MENFILVVAICIERYHDENVLYHVLGYNNRQFI